LKFTASAMFSAEYIMLRRCWTRAAHYLLN